MTDDDDDDDDEMSDEEFKKAYDASIGAIETLVTEVLQCIESFSAFQYVLEPEDVGGGKVSWSIRICEGVTELVGGGADGARVTGGFSADVYAVMRLLQPPPRTDYPYVYFGVNPVHGTHVSIEGVYAGHSVLITLCGEPFDDTVRMRSDEKGRFWEVDESEEKTDG